jgi:hypothetical protein
MKSALSKFYIPLLVSPSLAVLQAEPRRPGSIAGVNDGSSGFALRKKLREPQRRRSAKQRIHPIINS